ncbi:hypothetical protein AO378_1593 [Moraxella catarrhalis]|nr:hypothetical protein AO378_1593 [Moraxella catarrhalis]
MLKFIFLTFFDCVIEPIKGLDNYLSYPSLLIQSLYFLVFFIVLAKVHYGRS